MDTTKLRRHAGAAALALVLLAAPAATPASVGTEGASAHAPRAPYLRSLVANVGTEGAAEHAALAQRALIWSLVANVGTEGAAEHEHLR